MNILLIAMGLWDDIKKAVDTPAGMLLAIILVIIIIMIGLMSFGFGFYFNANKGIDAGVYMSTAIPARGTSREGMGGLWSDVTSRGIQGQTLMGYDTGAYGSRAV
jgi:hypothetical protein